MSFKDAIGMIDEIIDSFTHCENTHSNVNTVKDNHAQSLIPSKVFYPIIFLFPIFDLSFFLGTGKQ